MKITAMQFYNKKTYGTPKWALGAGVKYLCFSNPEAQWDGGDLSIIFDRCGFFKYRTIPLIQKRGKMKHLNEYLSISEQERDFAY